MNQYKPATEKELAAIKAVKDAIKALPRSIFMSVDQDEGIVEFWKTRTQSSAYSVGKPLRRKQAFNNSFS